MDCTHPPRTGHSYLVNVLASLRLSSFRCMQDTACRQERCCLRWYSDLPKSAARRPNRVNRASKRPRAPATAPQGSRTSRAATPVAARTSLRGSVGRRLLFGRQRRQMPPPARASNTPPRSQGRRVRHRPSGRRSTSWSNEWQVQVRQSPRSIPLEPLLRSRGACPRAAHSVCRVDLRGGATAVIPQRAEAAAATAVRVPVAGA